MSKELEAFVRLRNNIRLLEENTSLKYFFENDEFHFREDLDIIETALKAFEIIKEHFIKIGGTRGNFKGKKPTNEIVITLKDLAEEEFDLLKEVLL